MHSFSRRRLLIDGAGGLAAAAAISPLWAHSSPTRLQKADPLRIGEPRLELERRLGEIAAQYRSPGLAAGLIEKGRFTWAAGIGFADVDAKTPMSPSTLINFGSVTKTVTATAIL